MIFWGVLGVCVLFALITVALGIFMVEQQEVAVIQRFGRFLRLGEPGLGFKIPWVDMIADRISLKIEQLNLTVETKTEDNVFVSVKVAVQFRVIPTKVYDAFYKLDDPEEQISAFVFDVVRARLPKVKLDDAFEHKDEIAKAVADELTEQMSEFGYEILKALVTDIDPDEAVKVAMNQINAAQRERMAATERGEAERILRVKSAEAEAQSKALQGKGIADQRKAIVDGLRVSVAEFKDATGIDAREVMTLVLLTQYFDTLKELGGPHTRTILVSHSPGAIGELTSQIQQAIAIGSRMTEKDDPIEPMPTNGQAHA